MAGTLFSIPLARSVSLLSLLLLHSAASAPPRHSRVLLTDVQVLTLRRLERTTGRRSAPVPQLECRRGCSGAAGTYPEEMQCYNKGWDGQDVNWKCEAVLPKGAHLANVEVQCEGFDYPEDPYILAGSCGVSFEVVGGPAHHTSARAAAPSSDPRSGGDEAWSLWSYFKLGVFLLIFWKFCSCCCGGTRANPASPREGHRNAPQHSAYPYAYASCASAVPVPATATASSDPGFLAGLGVGAALGSAYERSRAPTAPVESSRRRGGGSDDAAAADDSGTEERSTAYAKTKRR